MFEWVKTTVTRLREGAASEEHRAPDPRSPRGNGNAAPPDRQPSSGLFQCQSCGTVYIARDKETCETCGTEVTKVRSTVRDRPNR